MYLNYLVSAKRSFTSLIYVKTNYAYYAIFMLQVDLYTIFASKNRWTTASSVKTSNNAVLTATPTRYLIRESTFFLFSPPSRRSARCPPPWRPTARAARRGARRGPTTRRWTRAARARPCPPRSGTRRGPTCAYQCRVWACSDDAFYTVYCCMRSVSISRGF